MLDSWPASQEDAEKAISDSRQTRREGGKVIDDVAPWSPDELILATRARLPLVKGAICAFKTGVVNLNQLLWTSAKTLAAPDTTAMWSTC